MVSVRKIALSLSVADSQKETDNVYSSAQMLKTVITPNV